MFTNVQNYITLEKEKNGGRNAQLYVGDEVEVVKTLGHLQSKVNSEYYYNGTNTTKVPLNTKGIITRIGSDNDGSYMVYFFDNIKTQYWFQRREIMPLASQDLSQIDLHLNAIRTYIQEVKAKK